MKLMKTLEDVKIVYALSIETDYRRLAWGGHTDFWKAGGAPPLVVGLKRLARWLTGWPSMFEGLYFAG